METVKREDLGGRLALTEAFAEVPDPRVAGRSKYDLVEMLVISVCAMVCRPKGPGSQYVRKYFNLSPNGAS